MEPVLAHGGGSGPATLIAAFWAAIPLLAVIWVTTQNSRNSRRQQEENRKFEEAVRALEREFERQPSRKEEASL